MGSNVSRARFLVYCRVQHLKGGDSFVRNGGPILCRDFSRMCMVPTCTSVLSARRSSLQGWGCFYTRPECMATRVQMLSISRATCVRGVSLLIIPKRAFNHLSGQKRKSQRACGSRKLKSTCSASLFHTALVCAGTNPPSKSTAVGAHRAMRPLRLPQCAINSVLTRTKHCHLQRPNIITSISCTEIL